MTLDPRIEDAPQPRYIWPDTGYYCADRPLRVKFMTLAVFTGGFCNVLDIVL